MSKIIFGMVLVIQSTLCFSDQLAYTYRPETSESSNVSIRFLTAKHTKTGMVVSGSLFKKEKFGATPAGPVTVYIQDAQGNILESQSENFHSPVGAKEWRREGVKFYIHFEKTPPENSVILVKIAK